VSDVIIVQVPANERDDLERLGRQVDEDDIQDVHPFDGETVAQLAMAVSTTSLPFLRAWIKGRIEARKGFEIVHDGTELRGYTADEADQILARLESGFGRSQP
jgi:hypothetical protein